MRKRKCIDFSFIYSLTQSPSIILTLPLSQEPCEGSRCPTSTEGPGPGVVTNPTPYFFGLFLSFSRTLFTASWVKRPSFISSPSISSLPSFIPLSSPSFSPLLLLLAFIPLCSPSFSPLCSPSFIPLCSPSFSPSLLLLVLMLSCFLFLLLFLWLFQT